jgi:hypothetical protein
VSQELLRTLARWHAVAAWAATIAVLIAALLHARRRLPAWAGALAAALALAAGGLGLALEEPYRSRLRQKLFLKAPSLGWLFERKLHLAVGALLLALAAAAALGAARHARREAVRRDLGRAAAFAFAAAAALMIAASIAATVVARKTSF